MAAFNQARMNDSKGNNQIRRWKHQELHIDHYDIHTHIQPNGKVIFKRPVRGSDEYDEIEFPASLIFKVANLLKITRKAEYVSVTEVPKEELAEIQDLKAAEELDRSWGRS